MKNQKDISILLIGDQSPCLEHVIRSFYNMSTGQDSTHLLKECSTAGINCVVDRSAVNIRVMLATTRTAGSTLGTDEVRSHEYESWMNDIDVILLCFYQNNSKTLHNLQTKYLDEIKQWLPKKPYFLLGTAIEESVGGVTRPLRDTISTQDKWLKRDLSVSSEDSKQVAKQIRARRFLECYVFRKVETRASVSDEFHYDFERCRNIKESFDTAVRLVLKKRNSRCVLL